MSGKPTFHMTQDWVALLELGPAARTILSLLHCNALFGRNGAIDHTVHVTSAWFVEMTSHWEKPMTAPTARRGMGELIEKGVLIRLNEPNDGVGFIVSFASDPGPEHKGPVNGFEHAKEVSNRCGTRAFYRRLDEDGSLLETRRPGTSAPRLIVDEEGDLAGELDGDPEGGDEEPEFDTSVFDSGPMSMDTDTADLTMAQQEFAAELETMTAASSEPRLRLLPGQCDRIAKAAHPALGRGWSPKALARRMASELNPKIHSPEQLLVRKLSDVGDPPPKRRTSTLETHASGNGGTPVEEASEEAAARVEAAKARYMENLRMRQMAGKGR